MGIIDLFLTEFFLCLVYAAENLICAFASDEPDVPRTMPRKPD
jgi:hypothetical protein